MSSKSSILAFGEILLRLKSPCKERLLQSGRFEATFAGSEANTAVDLALWGIPSAMLTALPDNPVGRSCSGELARRGVDTGSIRFNQGRMGIFFLEAGSGPRPSQVVYDRDNSALHRLSPADIDTDKLFKNTGWFHLSGITPALSRSLADLSLYLVREAVRRDIPVSMDLNYRGKLWQYGVKPSEVMTPLVEYCSLLLGNEEDCEKMLDFALQPPDGSGNISGQHEYAKLVESILNRFKKLDTVALSLRESRSADDNSWSGLAGNRTGIIFSEKYILTSIVDRLGAGDSFSAGIIRGLFRGDCLGDTLNFAVAASCLKHTIPGDFALCSTEEIASLVKGNQSGRVKR
jgi:2-dehydro-3-deoxygluconokinase